MKSKHKAYEVTDEIFHSFAKNNGQALDKMRFGQFRPIEKFECTMNLHQDPWNVWFIGKRDGMEGPYYSFINDNHEKIYDYYDVE